MVIKREFPKTMEQLIQIVAKYTRKTDAVAVQAGHFLVYYDHTENLLLPCVKEELLSSPRFSYINESVGQFPMLTWEAGVELVNSIPSAKKALLTIVNDWQYLPKDIDRMDFFRKYPQLFESYKKYLNFKNGLSFLSPGQLGMKTETGVWFSEVSLRNQFNRKKTKKIKKNELHEKYIIERKNNQLSCSLMDTVGKKQQVYCAGKRGNCTHELAELNRQVLQMGNFDLLINFFPLVCKNYVQTGTDWAYELFLDQNITINIGMVSTFVSKKNDLFENCEVTIHGKP